MATCFLFLRTVELSIYHFSKNTLLTYELFSTGLCRQEIFCCKKAFDSNKGICPRNVIILKACTEYLHVSN